MRILEQHHRGLLNEIWHTDRREFKLALGDDEKTLEALVNHVREMKAVHVHG